MIELRDGTLVESLDTDVILEEDPRSLEEYAIGPVAAPHIIGRHWKTHQKFSQGNTGKCVMHAIAHERTSEPTVCKVTASQINEGHNYAQRVDRYPNDGPQFGTSLLAGCKFARAKGWISSYQWMKNADDVLSTVSHRGPVVVVVAWPGRGGALHAVCATLVSPNDNTIQGPNSWGNRGSTFKFGFDQFRRIFRQGVLFSGRRC